MVSENDIPERKWVSLEPTDSGSNVLYRLFLHRSPKTQKNSYQKLKEKTQPPIFPPIYVDNSRKKLSFLLKTQVFRRGGIFYDIFIANLFFPRSDN